MKFDIYKQSEEVLIGEGSIKNKKAKITAKNTGYIFSLLSKIYPNPPAAICREVSSNCFDAHMKLSKQFEEQAERELLKGGDLELVDQLLTLAEEKKNQPVVVRHYLDEDGQNYIEFVDQGTGISVELMDEVFMSYGESDKREDDDYIGAFGLGSKSPFSYSEHFFVITKSEGVKYTYLLYETPAGPEYDILEEESTEEPNGTVIRVPFKPEDFSKFETALISQLRYFKNIFVLGFPGVNNEYKIHKYDSFQLRDDIFRKAPNDPLHIVIGDVYYPIDFATLGLEIIGINVALRFEIGVLKVTPSRDALEYNDQTIPALTKKIEEFKKEIKEKLLNKSDFISPNLLTYQQDVESLKKDTLIARGTLIPEEDITLQFSKLSIFKKEDVRYSVKLGKSQVHFDVKYLSPWQQVKPILMSGNYENDYKLTVYKTQAYQEEKKLLNIYTENNTGKYIVIPKNKLKLKKNERAYLNEEVKVSRVLHFDEKLFWKTFIKNVHIFDLANGSEKRIKNLTLSEVKDLIGAFKKQYKEEIFSINFKYIEDYNIPNDYGFIKKAGVTLQDGSILTYTLNRNGSFVREERPAKLLFDSLSTGYFKEKIILYGEESEKNTLYNLARFELQSLRDSKLIVFYCSKKYFKLLEMMPNTFNLKSIEQKENSSFVKHPYVIKTLSENLRKNIALSVLKTGAELLPFRDLKRLNYRKGYLKMTKEEIDFSKIINNSIFKEMKIETPNISETQIKKFFSDTFYINFKKKIEDRLKVKLEVYKIWDKFSLDFYFELDTFYQNQYSSVDYLVPVLHNSLKNKAALIADYKKQIKQLK